MLYAKIGIAALIIAAAYSLHIVNKERDKVVEQPIEPELCEVGTVNPDGTVTYSQEHPGKTELLVLATQSGIKVLALCDPQ